MGRSLDPSLDPPSFAVARSLLRRAAGIELGDDKHYLVESRLAPLAEARGMSLNAFLAALHGRLDLQERVVEALLNHETSFFRDWHPFEALRLRILPELIDMRRPLKTLRIWCAACSAGQEPYSVALLLKEHFPELADWDVTLLASDISADILDRARDGRYKMLETNRGLPSLMLLKYFERVGNQWRVKADVRRMVEFTQLNLVEPWPSLPTMDLVLMRNVLIYMDLERKLQCLQRARDVLSRDGYLFLGSAETTILLDPCYQPIRIDKSVVYRPCRP